MGFPNILAPEVGGIDCGVDVLLDESDGDGLCEELMQDPIEGIRTQSVAELGEGRVGGGVEEVEATEQLKTDIELELVRQVSLGGGFSHIAQEFRFEHADGGIGLCTSVGVKGVGQSWDEAPIYHFEGVVDGIIRMELGLGEDVDWPRQGAGGFEGHRIPPGNGCRWIEHASMIPKIPFSGGDVQNYVLEPNIK